MKKKQFPLYLSIEFIQILQNFNETLTMIHDRHKKWYNTDLFQRQQ